MSDRFQPATYPVPASDALVEFMRTGWSDDDDQVERLDVAPWAAQRRAKLAERFPGERIVVPAGPLKPRANDTDYRFRAETAHVYLTGNQSSDAVLVIDDGEATLYFRPRHAKSDDAFWRDGRYGEAWAGRRLSLAEATETLRHPLPPPLRPSRRPARLGEPPGSCAASTPTSTRSCPSRVTAAPTRSLRRPPRPRCGSSRTRGRSSSCRTPSTPRSSASRTRVREWDNVAEVRRALDRGHVLAARPGERQRRRLRVHLRGRPARHHPALDRERRPDHPRRSWCCSTWASRTARSTPPT